MLRNTKTDLLKGRKALPDKSNSGLKNSEQKGELLRSSLHVVKLSTLTCKVSQGLLSNSNPLFYNQAMLNFQHYQTLIPLDLHSTKQNQRGTTLTASMCMFGFKYYFLQHGERETYS